MSYMFFDSFNIFPRSIFRGLSNLQHLDLRHIHPRAANDPLYEYIRSMPSLFNDITNLENLEYLDLSFCKLQTLLKIMNLANLKYLDVSVNFLDSILFSKI